jgi:dTDP-4-dehydrorhamnose 3,5-epimerase
MIESKPLPIAGAAIAQTNPYADHRGLFGRLFCREELGRFLGERDIVNVNFSRTSKVGAVRGLHFQHPPKTEMKLVRCLRGKVFDVIVDLREGSPTFLHWHGEILSAENLRMMILPEGVAHGFQTMENDTEMLYLHTEFFSPAHDSGVRYDDPRIGIDWPLSVAQLSYKDTNYPLITEDFKGLQI